MKRTIITVLLAAAVPLLAPAPAAAGPALICLEYQIGDARSLPWGGGGGGGGKDWHSPSPSYQRERLVGDTLALLVPATPVLVRMETLRRATLYAKTSAEQGRELLTQMMARALDAEARGATDGLAWFDAGYLAASMQQAAHLDGYPRLAAGIDGYRWVRKAITARNGDADMELAAALMKREETARPGEHLPRARAGAKKGSLLERNLVALFPGR